jgi:hypothetical protein
MTIKARAFAAALIAVAGLTVTSRAQAAAFPISAKRAADLRRCNDIAVMHYPAGEDARHGREEVYAACMTEAGELP